MALKINEQFDNNGNLLNGFAANQSSQTQVSVPNTSNRYSDISDDTELEIAEKKLRSGKSNFGNDAQRGFILGVDDKDGKVKFEIGRSASNMLKYDGDDLQLKGGDISGGTFSVPNPASPLFSVDSSGNVVASSLRRKDFHWYTVFESIDGYFTSGTGTAIGVNSMQVGTGAVSGNTATISKISTLFKGFTFNKKQSVTFNVKMGASFASGAHTAYFTRGASTGEGFGFKIVDNVINGYSSHGGTETLVDLADTSDYAGAGTGYSALYRVDFEPGVGCYFYIDNVLKGSSTTNLPTGTTTAYILLDVNITTNENVAKILDICYYDFWQAL